MKEYQIINNHILIRETIGYDFIKQLDVIDIPNVLSFLNIVFNYVKMKRINK